MENIISQYAHRMHCLSISATQLAHFNQAIFSNLTSLPILGSGNVKFSIFNRTQFPRLLHFELDYDAWLDELPISADIVFPPLEYLAIPSTDTPTSMQILQGCSSTLKFLEICSIPLGSATSIQSIQLPILESLKVEGWAPDVYWPFHLITPSLLAYTEILETRLSSFVGHKDVGLVTHLRTDDLSCLADYVSLRVLQVTTESSEQTAVMMQQLNEIGDACPALHRVEIIVAHRDRGKDHFEMRRRTFDDEMQRRGRNITSVLLYQTVDFWRPMPGYARAAGVSMLFSFAFCYNLFLYSVHTICLVVKNSIQNDTLMCDSPSDTSSLILRGRLIFDIVT